MAGEYVRWLARDVKPLEKQELTPRQKRRNWWDYHKWHVLIAVVGLLFAANLVSDVVRNTRNEPDYTIAYVGQTELPIDLIEKVEEALAEYGEDLNGNGEVQVVLREYRLYDESTDLDQSVQEEYAERSYNDSMLLTVNIETAESLIYLLEDPELFGSTYPILCHTDGALPEEGSDAPMYYLWKDCPVLAGLELGTFQLPDVYGPVEGDCQSAMSGLAVARRGIWEDGAEEKTDGAVRLWEILTEGAAK